MNVQLDLFEDNPQNRQWLLSAIGEGVQNACGVGIFWRAESKSRKICLMCETWAEGYRKKNKEQTNLFAQE